MITRENIIERLEKKYPQYSFIPTEVTKNGDVHLQAISVRSNTPLAPTIYTESIIARCEDNLEQAVEIICNIIDQHKAPDIDVNMLTDRNFLLSGIRVGVQKESDEILVKHAVNDFPGMEAYLYVTSQGNNDMWSVKIKPEILTRANIPEDEAWQVAEKHTYEATTLQSMAEVLAEMMGDSYDKCLEDVVNCEMYVISNREKCKGAASILNRALLQSFAKEHNCDALCVLPSSLHEAILVPLQGEYHIEDFNAMVCEINETQVAPEDVLVNRAYIIRFDE